MLICIFLSSIQSKSISLTNETFHQILQNYSNVPIMMEFWDPWCPHCKKFRPIFQQFAEQYEDPSKIIFADCNCVENTQFCHLFQFDGYPAVLWHDPVRRETFYFNGAYNQEGLFGFMNKQLFFPILFLTNSSSFNDYLKQTNIASIFRIDYFHRDDKKFDLLKKVIQDFRQSDAFFIAIQNSSFSSFQFSVYPDSSPLYFTSNYTYDNLHDFIDSNILSLLPQLTGRLFDSFQNNRQKALVFFIEKDSNQYDEAKKFVSKYIGHYSSKNRTLMRNLSNNFNNSNFSNNFNNSNNKIFPLANLQATYLNFQKDD